VLIRGLFPRIPLLEQCPHQFVIQGMPGFVSGITADQSLTEKIQITYGIKNLVAHEFVFVAESVHIENPVIIQHHGIVNRATARQVVGTQVFNITHETESTRTTDFMDEGGGREINSGGLSLLVKGRVVKVDGKTDLESVERLKTGPFVALSDLDCFLDPDEFLGGIQFLDTSRLDQENERPGAPIHYGKFVSGQFHNGIVNAKAGHG